VVGATDCSRALVFTRTKHGADKVARQLGVEGIRADAIHGNKSQSARERALSQFRAGKLHVLVATDVAARGIDVDGISHVINYDVPTDPESYVHRIGRTGRAGATGIALTFCESSERGAFRDIEKLVRQRIQIASGSPGTHSHEATGQRHRPAGGQPSQGRNKSFSAAGKKRHNHRHFGKKRLASSWR
jgi:ATP-dependent RNA helicase RhlE